MAEAEEVTFNATLAPFPVLYHQGKREMPFLLCFVLAGKGDRMRCCAVAAVELPRDNGSPGMARAAHTHHFFVPTVRNLQHVRIPARANYAARKTQIFSRGKTLYYCLSGKVSWQFSPYEQLASSLRHDGLGAIFVGNHFMSSSQNESLFGFQVLLVTLSKMRWVAQLAESSDAPLP